jgi:hypothetical protein
VCRIVMIKARLTTWAVGILSCWVVRRDHINRARSVSVIC